MVLRFVVPQLCLILADLGLGLVQDRLIGPRIEFKEYVPLLDQRSFREVDLFQIAPHVRPHFYGIDCGRPGGEVGVVGDVLLHGITGRDRRRRNFFGCGTRLRAAGEAEAKTEHEATYAEEHVNLTFLAKKAEQYAVPTSGPFASSLAKGLIPGRATSRPRCAAARSGRQPRSGWRRNRRN